MAQPDAHQRVRQTAAARVIGRAWQHVRLAIQVSGTACLALRRYDKAAAKEGNRSESHLESEDGARGDGGTGRKARRAKIMESDSEDSGSEDEGFRTNKGGPGQGAMAATAYE